jgi:hypothetical protein
MLQRSLAISVRCIEDTNMVKPVERKDDKRQLLLKWFKRVFCGPWLFRLLMIVWKLYDHYER